ncbi:Cyclin-B1-1 [Platanthera zijinensis]|uniref:Cyclin-B1-1 n=1 Tax=Platanthera zijinensis TaxID=2320716 RepID=A0AAP0BI79_9ASPA
MVGFHSSAQDGKLIVIYWKYSKEELGGVALRSPATNFVEKLMEEHQNSYFVDSFTNLSVRDLWVEEKSLNFWL